MDSNKVSLAEKNKRLRIENAKNEEYLKILIEEKSKLDIEIRNLQRSLEQRQAEKEKALKLISFDKLNSDAQNSREV